MMLLALLFSCMVVGSFASCSDNEDRCRDPNLANELKAVMLMPSKEQLRTLCPKVISFFECKKETLECSGKSLEELSTSSDISTVRNANLVLGATDLVRDLCDEDSSLHRDYIANIDCVRPSMDANYRRCEEHIPEVIEEFFDKRYADESETNHAEIMCLRTVSQIGCVVDQIGKSCGSDAQRTAIAGLEKLKAFLRPEACQRLENDANLKKDLLDFLDLSETRRNNMQRVFDLLKRRR